MSDLYSKASLVMDPQLVDTGKVYSIKPENRRGDFDFTRSSAATRVNASGNIEKETQNLLNYSNDFSQSAWVNTDAGVTGGQAGYDGSSNAWLLTKFTGGSFSRNAQGLSTSGVQVFSIYAKANTLTWIRLLGIGSSNNPYAYYDLSNGLLGAKHSSVIDFNIKSIGNGWYRCDMVFNEVLSEVRIYPVTGDGDFSTAGSIYIQDVQLEQGLVARDYIETTTTAVEGGITDNVPRLDYTDSSCPALLLEPQRQNIVNFSEYFEKLGTYNFINCILTANDATSPEGVDNAYSMVANTTNGTHYFYHRTDPNLVLGQDYSMSIFVKANGYNRCHLTFNSNDGTFSTDRAIFNLTDGSIVSQDADLFNVDIVPYGDGWYRVMASCEALANADGTLLFGIVDDNNNIIFSGNGTDGLYIYGYQVERLDATTGASYTTSYIPTYGSTVTRVLETCSTSSNASTFNSTEGVLYAEVEALANADVNRKISLNDGTSDNSVVMFYYTLSDYIFFQIYKAGTRILNLSVNNVDKSILHKIAFKYKNSDYSVWIDGVELLTDSLADNIPANTLNKLSFDGGVGAYPFNGKVNAVQVYKEALTDTELAALTTI